MAINLGNKVRHAFWPWLRDRETSRVHLFSTDRTDMKVFFFPFFVGCHRHDRLVVRGVSLDITDVFAFVYSSSQLLICVLSLLQVPELTLPGGTWKAHKTGANVRSEAKRLVYQSGVQGGGHDRGSLVRRREW